MTDSQIIVGAFALIGVIVGVVVKWTSDLVGALQRRIDQLEAAAEKRDERIEKLERRERVAEQYIDDLRAHINAAKPPPPPPWPHDF